MKVCVVGGGGNKRTVLALLCMVSLWASLPVKAEVRLPNLLSHGMVLQRDLPVRIWGWADPDEHVMVSLAGREATGQADAQGEWTVQLEPLAAGGPYVMTVAGVNTLTITNILVGEVWVASGQSNMEMKMNSIDRPDELTQADFPAIRQFSVLQGSDIEPRVDAEGTWQTCSPSTIRGFSAVGYFYARELHNRLQVPVGIVCSAWGGTMAESWISKDMLKAESSLERAWKNVQDAEPVVRDALRDLTLDDGGWMLPDFDDTSWKAITLPHYWDYELYPIEYDGVIWARRTVEIPLGWAGKPLKMELTVDDFETTYFNGREIGRTSKHTLELRSYAIPASDVQAGTATLAIRTTKLGWGGIVGPKKRLRLILAEDPSQDILLAGDWKYAASSLRWTGIAHRVPSVLFNAMIAPLTSFTIRGVIWYQGEANAYLNTAHAYRQVLPALIRDWRLHWGQGDFPFYFVQLPNYKATSDDPNAESAWALLRESQLETLSAVPNTGMAVTIELGEANDIHPKNKWDVGQRLALQALEKTYGLAIAGQSPLLDSIVRDGNALRTSFSHCTGGLTTRDGGPVKGFALAGADGQFVWADALVEGESVSISNEMIGEPVYIRFAWGDNPVCNLVGTNGLPVSPFRAALNGKAR